jgi:glycosyltransferase involved in cell wall biosynthesis
VEPLVSILIPAYNCERTIADTLRSALDQTWKNTEIVVVDDGSRDQTLTVARQFASKSVAVVPQNNQGAAAARNKAFSTCQGDYIQWLDADDLLHPDKIRNQMARVREEPSPNTLWSSAWGHFIYRADKTVFAPTALWRDLMPIEWAVTYLAENHWMQPANWLVSRELTQKAGPWNVEISLDDDGEYFFRVVLASDRVRFVPESKVYYRRNLTSLSYMGRSPKKARSQFQSLRLQFGHLRAIEDSPRVRTAALKYLQTYFIHFYPEMPELVQEAKQLAAELGGELRPPRLPLKYAWIQKTFGWTAAKQTQLSYNKLKSSLIRSWDKAMFRLQRRTSNPHARIL